MKRDEKIAAVIIVVFAVLCFTSLGHCKEKDVAVWLARSCVGEAGFDAYKTGECLSIWHVYKKRAELSGRTVLGTCLKYSAAVKTNKHTWVKHLNRTAVSPKYWPARLNWEGVYWLRWIETYQAAERFLKGGTKDPRPTALHYGGSMDVGLNPKVWRRLERLLHRNIFYELRR